jgi:hypothetical protein
MDRWPPASQMEDDLDTELRAHLEAMEARLVARMNDAEEKLLDQLRVTEMATAGLAATVSALAEVARRTQTMLATIVGSRAG